MKNKLKRGRPRVAKELQRRQLITTVSPETIAYLESKPATNGRIIDELVKKELIK